MFTSFLDKLNSLFDKRFLIAYWGPLLIGLALAVAVWSTQAGATAAGVWWDAQSATQQLLLMLGALFAVTILAFVLQAFTVPLVRLYEGYWPSWLDGLEGRCIKVERARRNGLLLVEDEASKTDNVERTLRNGLLVEDEASKTDNSVAEVKPQSRRAAYYSYPNEDNLIRATRLGNTMTAAEEYTWFVYRADAVIWWPRLTAILPDALRSQLDGAFTPIAALLNLCTILLLWAVAGSGWLLSQGANPWLFALVFGGGLLLAWSCYRAAITQAEEYGDLVRTAFDLHRRDLLKQLSLPLPEDLVREQRLWTKLGNLHYHRVYPWIPVGGVAADSLPFDNHSPPPAPPAPSRLQEVHVTLEGAPTVIVRRQGGE